MIWDIFWTNKITFDGAENYRHIIAIQYTSKLQNISITNQTRNVVTEAENLVHDAIEVF